jgi:hypothetical protein
MARNQKNFQWFLYVDDNAVDWDVFGESGGAASAVDGHTTDFTKPAWGRNTRRRHVRYCIWQDAVTFRTLKTIIYTPTAFAAIGAGDTIAASVAGLATTVNYTLKAKVPERQPIPGTSRPLADS